MTQRLCKICGQWHSLDEPWPDKCQGHYRPQTSSGIQIVKDIEPYKPIATDVDGKITPIMGRAQHREFLKRNNLVEVGNDPMKPRPPEINTASGHDVKRAIEQLRNRK